MTSLRVWIGFLPFSFVLATSALHCSGSGTSDLVDDGGVQDIDSTTGDEDTGVADDAGARPDAATPTCGKSCKGCCDGTTCVAPTTGLKCGSGGKACTSCAAAATGHVCVAGGCGCTASTDCAVGFSCNPATAMCEKGCSVADPCPTGCCSSAGLCANGNTTTSCGNGATCVDCTFGVAGHACLASGKCGCASASDCSSGYACDAATHSCTKSCSPSSPCNGGCCGAAGTCQTPSKTACGTGGACVDCTGKAEGTQCIGTAGNYACGCFGATDCAPGQACDQTTHACTAKCSAAQQCNGGCCNLSSGTCAPGTTDTMCGGVKTGFVATCESCPTSIVGGKCMPTAGSYVAKCGCSVQGDCAAPATCTAGRCCLPKGNFSGNSGLCCSGATLNQICQ